MLRKVSCLLLAVMLCLSLTACNKDENDSGAPGSVLDMMNSAGPSQTSAVGNTQAPGDTQAPADLLAGGQSDVDFNLNASSPAFGAVDLNNTPGQIDPAPEAIYIERDGFSYALDPDTLQVIDVPLDPVTHEPVEEEEPEPEPSVVEPTEENKYPNTGIFLEDD